MGDFTVSTSTFDRLTEGSDVEMGNIKYQDPRSTGTPDIPSYIRPSALPQIERCWNTLDRFQRRAVPDLILSIVATTVCGILFGVLEGKGRSFAGIMGLLALCQGVGPAFVCCCGEGCRNCRR